MQVRGIDTQVLAHAAFMKINMCGKLWSVMNMDLEFVD